MNNVKTGFEKESDILYMQELDQKLQQNPFDIETLIEKGFFQLEPFLQVENAVKTIEQVLKLQPNNVDVLFWLARTYYLGLCDDKKAKELLEKALVINSNRGDCHDLLSDIIKYWSNNADLALYHLNKAVECQPTSISFRNRLCEALIENGALDEAEQVLLKKQKIYAALTFPIPKTRLEREYHNLILGHYPEVKNAIDELLKKISVKRIELAQK